MQYSNINNTESLGHCWTWNIDYLSWRNPGSNNTSSISTQPLSKAFSLHLSPSGAIARINASITNHDAMWMSHLKMIGFPLSSIQSLPQLQRTENNFWPNALWTSLFYGRCPRGGATDHYPPKQPLFRTVSSHQPYEPWTLNLAPLRPPVECKIESRTCPEIICARCDMWSVYFVAVIHVNACSVCGLIVVAVAEPKFHRTQIFDPTLLLPSTDMNYVGLKNNVCLWETAFLFLYSQSPTVPEGISVISNIDFQNVIPKVLFHQRLQITAAYCRI